MYCSSVNIRQDNVIIGLVMQLHKECELMQQRAETAEAAVQKEGGLHRRELRRRAKELADMQEDLVQVCNVLRCLHSRGWVLFKRSRV